MLLAPAMLVHRLVRLQRELAAANKRGLWLEGPPPPAAEFGPALFEPDDLRRSRASRRALLGSCVGGGWQRPACPPAAQPRFHPGGPHAQHPPATRRSPAASTCLTRRTSSWPTASPWWRAAACRCTARCWPRAPRCCASCLWRRLPTAWAPPPATTCVRLARRAWGAWVLTAQRQPRASRACHALCCLYVAPPSTRPCLSGPPTHPPQAPAELSAAFVGCSLQEAAVFLRLVYSPEQATPGTLRAVHRAGGGRLLAAVAGLAHRLDAAGLLAAIEGYLQAAAAGADVAELISTVQVRACVPACCSRWLLCLKGHC